MNSHVNTFSRRIYITARNIGLPEPQARLAAAQASLETGYGKSVKGNNYFGIKAGSSWAGPVQQFRTWEEEGGKRVDLTDRFRQYDSLEESIKDWVATVERRWPEAMSALSFEEAVEGLRYGRSGGYATDSQYGNKLAYVERRIGDIYSPPSAELTEFVRKTEAEADLRSLLAGKRVVPMSPSIFDTHSIDALNTTATPIPANKPATIQLNSETKRADSRIRGTHDAVPVPRAKPSGNGASLKGNPFDLEKTQLKQQAKMLERNPVMARRMILAAGRDPKLFGFA